MSGTETHARRALDEFLKHVLNGRVEGLLPEFVNAYEMLEKRCAKHTDCLASPELARACWESRRV